MARGRKRRCGETLSFIPTDVMGKKGRGGVVLTATRQD